MLPVAITPDVAYRAADVATLARKLDALQVTLDLARKHTQHGRFSEVDRCLDHWANVALSAADLARDMAR